MSSPTGSFQVLELAEDYQAVYANLQAPGSLEGERRELSRSLTQTLAPPRIAGAVVLVHERSGLGSLGRAAWTFTPGTRLPRREPKICCDRTSPGSDGMQFFDQLLGGKTISYNYQWLRTAGPGACSTVHCDSVYMGRRSLRK